MTDDQPIVISVNKVSKNFRLPHEKNMTIKGLFTGLLSGRSFKERSFERQHALRSINFEIKKGEFFGIVGRNGSGKSTMLKLLAGIYQPSDGKIEVNGRLVPFIELGVGFNPELTGRENVYLNGALLNFSKSEVEKMYPEIVEFAEISQFMDQKLKNYSSGMQVRLAFSLAIRARADILLVDEVLAVGDADFQRKCFEYFKSLKKNKQTVVFVSHDMDAVREYCDRAILINAGEVACTGDAEKVAEEYTRLLNPPNFKSEDSVDQQKWGSGTVDINNTTLSNRLLRQDDNHLEIEVTAKALKDFKHGVVPGFGIKNEMGHTICGTNSKILRHKIPTVLKNQELNIIWQVPNIFNAGKYVIDVSVADGSDMTICQWWDNAAAFRVVNKEKTPYVVAPKINLKVSQ